MIVEIFIEGKFSLISVILFNQVAPYIQGKDKTNIHGNQTSFHYTLV
jgi:hypothetical protein